MCDKPKRAALNPQLPHGSYLFVQELCRAFVPSRWARVKYEPAADRTAIIQSTLSLEGRYSISIKSADSALRNIPKYLKFCMILPMSACATYLLRLFAQNIYIYEVVYPNYT